MTGELPRRIILPTFVATAIALVGAAIWHLTARHDVPNPAFPREKVTSADPLPIRMSRDGYVSSQICAKCHAEQHRTWHSSYHRTMTQVAGPQSVLAPFENVQLQSRGRTYDLGRRGDEFWITMTVPQEDGDSQAGRKSLPANRPPRVTSKMVVLTTGSHVAQTYWVNFGKGLMQVPWIYHLEEQRWIPDEDSFLLPQDTPSVNHQWNTNCVKCHTSGPNPGWTKETGYRTEVGELGISCEACHGPGEAHVRFREALKSKPATDAPSLDQDPITNPARTSPPLASQICAQCHSSHRESDIQNWLAHGSSFRPGEELEKKVRMHRFNTPETNADYGQGYWADGTCRTGGDEYLGLTTSKCFEGGKLSCLSCHSMHRYASTTDQLRPHMDSNEACLQCHQDLREKLPEHTHHLAQSSGSLCMNCHMPHITYALFKGIRSHRIDSPNAAVSAKTGRPAACNLCHLDQPLGRTADKLTEWYGQPSVELSDQQRSTSAVVTMALQGDAAQRVIAAWHLGWESARHTSREDWQAPFLAYLLDDPYSVVRYVSYRSLKKLPGFQDFNYDFLAFKERRDLGKAQALEIWRQQSRPSLGEPRSSILLDRHGQLNVEAAENIFKQRDNRRITILE